MRVLFLNQTFHPDVASTAQYASDLAATLAERGHNVTAVCSQRAYDDPHERYAARETWRGVSIRRISCTGFGKTARWRRAADFGSYMVNCALHLLALRRHDLVIGMTSPPLISWLAAMFTRLKGGRFVFWVMDLNPDEALAAGWLRDGSLSTKLLQALLKQSLDASSLVVALDIFMARRLEKKGLEPDRIVVLPPWSHDDAVRYDRDGRERFRKEHGLDGRFVVMYSGNHSPCHPLTTLLEAALALRYRHDIAFLFVGGGSEVATVRRMATERHLANVIVVPYQPLSSLAASLSSADLHVVVMGNAFVGIVHPCKVYNIRSLGIPYLYIGPAESHVTEFDPPYEARHGDVDAVVRQIEAAAAVADGRTRQSASVVSDGRTRARLLGELVEILERVGESEFRRDAVEGFSGTGSSIRPTRPTRPTRPESATQSPTS